MRTSFFLLSAVFLLGACDDATETTGPRSRAISAPTADVSGAYAAPLPPGPGVSAKPPAGFTAITVVESQPFTFGGVGHLLGWLSWGIVPMACPAGTTVIGGGFHVDGSFPNDLRVHGSKPAYNGWQVTVEETGPSSSTAQLKVTVICVR